ncbi:MAG: ABC transporter ATP-binding protein/permease [Corynebacterium provencense]|uniref:ABC transporter ATP-binding protein n=1 Tax=Corynebacterium provencense TaxID=1737425 RepID=UPI002989B96A|nr:ABC transporter ATP-binding protein/permease [Corynebacterium provencense]
MKLPLTDIVPRMSRMVSEPKAMIPALGVSAVAGLIEGLALAAVLPAISSLAADEAWWGLSTGGWLIVFAVLSLCSVGCNFLMNKLNYAVALDFLRSIHRLVGDRVSRQPLGWFARPLAGRLSRMVSAELMTTGEIFAHMIGPLVQKFATAVVVIVAAWFWNPLLGLVLTLSVPVFILITLCSTALARHGDRMHEPDEETLANRIVEYAQCQGALRSCGRSENFVPLTEAMDNALRSKKRSMWSEILGMMLSGAVTQGVIVALIAVTGSLAVSGALDPVPALAFIGLALQFTSTLSSITQGAMGLETRRPLLDSIDEVLTAEPLPEPEQAVELDDPGSIELRDVTFGYGDTPVLRDISFTVPSGTMVALVGPSGSGKTTVEKLISRFYDTDAGEVLVGGVPVTRQTTTQLMSQLSMVFQDVYLFDDTLEANIAVGRPDAPAAEIRHAADLAGVTDIAERLPDGWSTRVGEGGRALSGGERQRVAIARALLKKAPTVLLDEATSALDVENEAHIVASVEQLRREATVLVVAHRLDTISRADKIVLLSADGTIEAEGTHEELLDSGGTYTRFWSRLHDARGWRLVER